jgi:uncharacterized protein CbrC (UPF0167 family)
VVPGFTGSKQEAGLEHCQADSWRQGIKVFDLELCHGLSFVGEGGLVDVSILALATAHKQKQKQEQQPANAKSLTVSSWSRDGAAAAYGLHSGLPQLLFMSSCNVTSSWCTPPA